MITDAIKSLMRRKYYGYHIYIHNLANFDSIFLIKSMLKINKNSDIDIIRHQGKLISISLTFNMKGDKKRKGSGKIIFYDSMHILPVSLDKLSKLFSSSINTQKSKFPLKFLNNPNLDYNYSGEVPSIEYFYNISQSEYNEYKNLYKNKASLREKFKI